MSGPIDLGRRSLFRGQYKPSESMLLPPWALDQEHFLDLCTRCGDCVSACPENILTPGSGGFPTTDFTKNECTFCSDCVSACPTGALLNSESNAPWHQAPTINDQCLAQKGVVCRSCEEACEPEAINFLTKHIRGVAAPTINNDLCNGCGACISICPNDALTIQPLSTIKNKATPNFQNNQNRSSSE